ncbi:MAG: alginate export family protein [Gemmatimonadales bacterium]|nr:alginate export family protein [Gemmatimonadales bacterium]
MSCRRASLAIAIAIATRSGAGAARLDAQQATAYLPLRFDEQWTGRERRDVTDALKDIPLGPGGVLRLNVGGQLRARREGFRNFLAGIDASRGTTDDGVTLLRALLHADLTAGRVARAFVEARHATASANGLPAFRRPFDRDALDLQNAFLELRTPWEGATRLAVRAGRQELSLGSERIISTLDWANARRGWDGVTARAARGDLQLTAFRVRPVSIGAATGNATMDFDLLQGAFLTIGAAGEARRYEAHAIRYEQVIAPGAPARSAAHTFWHVGSRVVQPLPLRAILEVEGALQRGRIDGSYPHRAWFVASELTAPLPALPWSQRLTAGFDIASGDTLAGDGVRGTYRQLFPAVHTYHGYGDLLGRGNLIDARLVWRASPSRAVELRAAAHHFLRAQATDGVFGINAEVLVPRGVLGRQRHLGDELDLTAAWRVGRHLRVDGGIAWFRPGAAPRAAGVTRDVAWAFSSVAVTF